MMRVAKYKPCQKWRPGWEEDEPWVFLLKVGDVVGRVEKRLDGGWTGIRPDGTELKQHGNRTRAFEWVEAAMLSKSSGRSQ